MNIKPAGPPQLSKAISAIKEAFHSKEFVYPPTFKAHMDYLFRFGGGRYFLARDTDESLAAILFIDTARGSLMPIFFTGEPERQRDIISAFEERHQRVNAIHRPPWDLRRGDDLVSALAESGFAPGPPEVLFRLDTGEYSAGFETRDEVDGQPVEYTRFGPGLAAEVAAMPPLFKQWSGFFGLEAHDEETSALFTASLAGEPAAILWVLHPHRCQPLQNDCYLCWKELMGEESIFVRSTVTGEACRGKGIGSSLHRFMLSHYFEGKQAREKSFISTNAENRPNIGLLESLGYRQVEICRYHMLFRNEE